MIPGPVSHHLHLLTPVKQQLIARISPKINAPMLKPGGIRANEHCVAFPQPDEEPAKIAPKLPEEIRIPRVRKKGTVDTRREFKVRHYIMQ